MTELAVLAQDPRFGGGSRTLLEAFLRESEALGRDSEVFHLAYRSLAHRAGLAGSHVHPVPQVVPQLDALNQVVAGFRLARMVRTSRSTWVVAASASHGFAAVRSGRPYAAWIGTSLDDEWRARLPGLPFSRRAALRLNRRVLRRLERETLAHAAQLYAISPWSQDRLAEAAGRDPADIEVLPIPVDLDRFRPLDDEVWREHLGAPELVFVGRSPDPRKNVRLLLAALPLVRAAIPTATVRLIGEPPQEPVPEGVVIEGRVADVAPLLRSGSIFVLPSLQEGFGIVAAEALAAGIPVVTTPSGGPEDLVRTSGGGTVLSGFGPEELAVTLTELLRQPDILTEMRRRGREHVTREHAPARLRERLRLAFDRLDALY
jgi:glycosyltransferase involved in cell wall biosynthesis